MKNGGLLPTLLLVLFIGLKLGNVIDWDWLWVLSPAWIPFGIAGAIFLVGVGVVGILVLCGKISGRGRWKFRAYKWGIKFYR